MAASRTVDSSRARPPAGERPWIGASFPLVLTQAAAPATASLLVGTSATSWGAAPLPIDLGPLGMTGCWLRVRPTFLLLPNATARWDLALPMDPALIGGSKR